MISADICSAIRRVCDFLRRMQRILCRICIDSIRVWLVFCRKIGFPMAVWRIFCRNAVCLRGIYCVFCRNPTFFALQINAVGKRPGPTCAADEPHAFGARPVLTPVPMRRRIEAVRRFAPIPRTAVRCVLHPASHPFRFGGLAQTAKPPPFPTCFGRLYHAPCTIPPLLFVAHLLHQPTKRLRLWMDTSYPAALLAAAGFSRKQKTDRYVHLTHTRPPFTTREVKTSIEYNHPYRMLHPFPLLPFCKYMGKNWEISKKPLRFRRKCGILSHAPPPSSSVVCMCTSTYTQGMLSLAASPPALFLSPRTGGAF